MEPFLYLATMKLFASFFLAIFLFGCHNNSSQHTTNEITISSTPWRFTLNLSGSILPFNGIFSDVNTSSATLTLSNHSEKIVIDDVILRNDSVIVQMPYFNSVMKLRIESPHMMSGHWNKLDKKDYSIPLNAEQGPTYRFTNTKSNHSIAKRYKVQFEVGTEDEYPAILVIENNEGKLNGTFLTETGDYRYLEGNIMNDQLHLSTFDGSHAFYFKADIKGDSLINGLFKSGKNYVTDWYGLADSAASLKSPSLITKIDNNLPFDFNLQNHNGDYVTWQDLNLQDKVVIIEIMGTWCPNCMDAANALSELKKPYSPDEIVVIPVLFEYNTDISHVKKAYAKYQKKIPNMPERFLLGGKASKKIAGEKFPMLSSISSFPTLLFIDKNRNVREVYTGFYGPGTGNFYKEFMQTKKELIAELVNT